MDLNLLMEIVLLWEQKKQLKTLYFFVMIDYPCAEHHNHRVFIRKGKKHKGPSWREKLYKERITGYEPLE